MNSAPGVAEDAPMDTGARSLLHRIALLLPYLLALAVAVGYLFYAEIRAFVWDEGFHLVAAQLIEAGKRPYIDFCFPQTPLNAYWNAGWMRLFGQSWHVTHVAAALLTIGTYLLAANYLLSRLSIPGWRLACSTAGTLFIALSITVVEFGPIAQAYAMCLFTTFAAFRLTAAAVARQRVWFALAAGVFAGIAAGSSLLSAPVAPVLFIWLLFANQHGTRRKQALAFVAGCAIPFAPLLWLFAQAPYPVFFNVVQYQTLFRRVNWGDAGSHDIDVLSSWVNSGQTLILTSLAIAGFVYVKRESGWDARIRREFYLIGSLALALIAYISAAHPTFSRYFVIAVPFMAILAAPGLYWVASRLVSPRKPFWPTVLAGMLFAIALGHELFVNRDSSSWKLYEKLAKQVQDVTPRDARLFADENVYFLLHWTPPRGMEFSYSHKLQLPPQEEATLHIISDKELQAQATAGQFATVETCDDDRIDNWQLNKLFKKEADIEDCSVFWEFNPEAHITVTESPKKN